MQRVSEEMEERRARFQALSEKSGNCRKAAGELQDDIQILQARDVRRGSCASQSNGCRFDPGMVEQIFARGAAQTEHFQAMQEEFNKRFQAPATPEQMAGGGEREDWEGDWMTSRRQVGGVKALRWVLL